MRDPLSLIPVRYKLPLTFAFLCTVAFGFGGYIVLTTARDAMENQIRVRLTERAANTDLVLDKDLELLGRRVEDFASDGHIRLQLERLLGGADDAAAELVRHLQTNKLPLVDEFTDAALLDAAGDVLVRAYSTEAQTPPSFSRDRFWYGPLTPPDHAYPYPRFILSTPVRAIEGDVRLGYLQLVVRADVWAKRVGRGFSGSALEGMHIDLAVPDGFRMTLYPQEDPAGSKAAASENAEDWMSFREPNVRTGWIVEVAIDRRSLLEPVRTLVWKFIYLGLALVLLAFLLLLPSRQFLLKPLALLEGAARKIAGGDFSARVGYRSDDEVGHLSHAFDVMAAAVEERTLSLSKAADDLTRREADIRLERDRLNTVIHSMKDGLFILDRDGEVLLANTAARIVLDEMSAAGRSAGTRDCGQEDRGGRNCLECIQDYRRPAQNCEVAIGARSYEIRATSLHDTEGNEAGRVFVSRDVTERMLRASQEAHQERLSVLGEVAAVMAHEMNNPLAAISMFTQMLLAGLDTGSELHGHAEVVHRNTATCKRAIRSLLDMATASTSEYEDFEVRDLVNDVVQMLGPIADRGKVSLEYDGSAEDGFIRGDELQLRQALVNLVMNGIQAVGSGNPNGQVRVSVDDENEDRIIRVEDSGPGIDADLVDRIFDPFFTTKPPGEGTGLGLPTTRRIVEAHGGRISVENRAEGGAEFTIRLPRSGEDRS